MLSGFPTKVCALHKPRRGGYYPPVFYAKDCVLHKPWRGRVSIPHTIKRNQIKFRVGAGVPDCPLQLHKLPLCHSEQTLSAKNLPTVTFVELQAEYCLF